MAGADIFWTVIYGAMGAMGVVLVILLVHVREEFRRRGLERQEQEAAAAKETQEPYPKKTSASA